MKFYDLPQEIQEYVYNLAQSDTMLIEDNEDYYLNIFIKEIERFINEDCEIEYIEEYEYYLKIANNYKRLNKIDKILQ